MTTAQPKNEWRGMGSAAGTRRVLMLAYYFPPCMCWPTASERAYGLARGLAELGWRPFVVTRQVGAPGCSCGAERHDPANGERPSGMDIIRVQVRRGRVRSGALGRVGGFLAGRKDDWPVKAEEMVRRSASASGVDVVWTTSGPIASVGSGAHLQRSLSVPWVADLRDGVWRNSVKTISGTGPKAWALRRRASLLSRPLRRADAVVHVWPQDARSDAGLLRRPSHVIPSAFDEREWATIHARGPAAREEEQTLRVLLAGFVYRESDAFPVFFEGARRYAESPFGRARPLRLAYMGPTFDRVQTEAEREGMAEALVDLGIVSLERSREAMRDADVLLLPTAVEGSTRSSGGKLYEYLAASTPILAIPGIDGFVADVLGRTEHGVCAPDGGAVLEALERVASGSLSVPPWPGPELDEFTWPMRARALADVFEACLGRRA